MSRWRPVLTVCLGAAKPAGKAGRRANPCGRPFRKATHIYSQLNHILSVHEAKNRNRSKTRRKYGSNIENSKTGSINTYDKTDQRKDDESPVSMPYSWSWWWPPLIKLSFGIVGQIYCYRYSWEFVEFLIQITRTTIKVCQIIFALEVRAAILLL